MRPQIKNFYKTDPPKSGNSDSKYNIEIFKNQKLNSKTPWISTKSRTHIRGPQIKKVIEKRPPKIGNYDAKYKFKIFKNQKFN